MRRTDPLIVGGGPAGAAAAITLALGGARPRVIERTAGQYQGVCGAFLGWDALAGLEALGLDPWALGARAIDRVRIVAGGTIVERRLPIHAAGLSRQRLDAALIARAEEAGAEVTRGIAARRVEDDRVHLADGGVIESDALFLATGKHDLRGAPRVRATGAHIGLRAVLPPQPDLDGAIELHLIDGGYAGLLAQEDGRANLCLSVAARRLEAAGGAPDRLLAALAREAPRLAERCAGAFLTWSAVAAVPYGWRARETTPGRFRVGDQAAVISSIVGDGIAIALASGRAAAEAWLRDGGGGAPAFQRGFARRAARPIAIAGMLRRAAERPRLAPPLVALLGAMPGAIGAAARLTRIGH